MTPLKFAIRQLLKSPGFSCVAILTLALGIGANTAIFTVVDQLLVRPLPASQPERLALLAAKNRNNEPDFDFNYPLFRDFQRDNTVFSSLSAVAGQKVGLGTGGATERQPALLVSGNYFAMLGADPALGRYFAADEGVEIDDANVAVLSHGLWLRRFGASPQAIGQNITINGKPYTIIGVAPREFYGTSRGSAPDIYLPITQLGDISAERPGGEHPLNSRSFTWHSVLGRLKSGVTHAEAEAAMNLLARQIHSVTPKNTSTNLLVLPGAQGFTGEFADARLPLKLLFATAGLVLLIACANLASLQLARAAGRSRELAIRLALGAKRSRIVRELLMESLLLALAGGAAGLAAAAWISDLILSFSPPKANFVQPESMDWRVLGFALAASSLTGVVFGIVPAWRSSRPNLVPELKGEASGASRAGRLTWRNALIVLQIALSLMVLVSAGLCARSLRNLQKADAGFEPSRVILMSFDLGLNNYSGPQARQFFESLLEQARRLPGVEAAGLSANTPLAGTRAAMSIKSLEGYEPGPDERPWAEINIASPGYFQTIGVPLLQGRDFNASDAPGGPGAIIVNEAFVRRYFPGQNPLGKRVYFHFKNPDSYQIAGVVGSFRSQDLRRPPGPAMCFPVSQEPHLGLTLSVRTGLDLAAAIAAVRKLSQSLDANVPVFAIRTLSQQKNDWLALERMTAALLAGFGALALLLAALGIYGVLAYSVSRRTREIGIRMALGARISDVLRMVVRQGVWLTLAGMGLGLAGSIAVTRVLRSFLHDISPLDPATFAGVAILLSAVALLACWLPARRAAQVDPMEALRMD